MRYKSKKNNDSGVAAVELALLIPIFVLLIGGIIEFGHAWYINDHFLTDTTKHENGCQMNEPQLLSQEDDGKRNHTSKEGGHGSET